MSLVKRLLGLVGRDEEDAETYQCIRCGGTFDRDYYECPECGVQHSVTRTDDDSGRNV